MHIVPLVSIVTDGSVAIPDPHVNCKLTTDSVTQCTSFDALLAVLNKAPLKTQHYSNTIVPVDRDGYVTSDYCGTILFSQNSYLDQEGRIHVTEDVTKELTAKRKAIG